MFLKELTKKPVEYYGKEATAFTKKMVGGKVVKLKYDVQDRDKYGRLLAYVYLMDGTFLNAEIVKQGYGHASIETTLDRYGHLISETNQEGAKGLDSRMDFNVPKRSLLEEC